MRRDCTEQCPAGSSMTAGRLELVDCWRVCAKAANPMNLFYTNTITYIIFLYVIFLPAP